MSLISIITPAYNAEKTISLTIESVLAQTYKDIELIVVDDYSKDNTVEIISDYQKKDNRIKFYKNDKNLGVSKTRNFGISKAKGEWIAFLDSDDVWCEDKLEKQIQLAESTNADIVYCSYGIIDESGNKKCRDFLVEGKTDYKKMLECSVISCSTAIIKREHFKKYNFSSKYAHEDYALWMEMLRDGLIAVGNIEVLAYYRIAPGTRSASKINAAKNRWIIYRKHLKLSFLRSTVYIFRYMFKALKKYKKCN